jgi:4-carboxymuconolactone decarboxylase
MSNADWRQTRFDVMSRDLPDRTTPLGLAGQDFVYGQVWSRPGLSRRNRRWVTLSCVAAADAPGAIAAHVYAALNSGDMTLEEMLEFVLQFAVYCGWPKGSNVEMVILQQWNRIHEERGEPVPPWPVLDNGSLRPDDAGERIAGGIQAFNDINLVPAPPGDSPYRHAGILSFVFGHVWQRPGLSRRDRRFITIPCVGLSDAPVPIMSHVTSALHSGDVTKEEMDEVVLQFSAYYGFAKGESLEDAVETAWASMPT